MTEETKQQTKKIEKLMKFLKILSVVFVFLIVTFVAIQLYLADKYDLHAKIIAVGEVGINPTENSLDYGDLPLEATAIRYVSLNAQGIDTYVYILKFGSISELIDISENNFTMKKGDEKKIEFVLSIPESAQTDQDLYGKIWIFKIPKIW